MSKGFGEKARERIKQAVKTVEGTRPRSGHFGGAQTYNAEEPLIGKAPATITKGTSGLVNIYRGTTKGSETYTSGDDKSSVYARLGDLTAGKWLYLFYRAGGWEAVQIEC